MRSKPCCIDGKKVTAACVNTARACSHNFANNTRDTRGGHYSAARIHCELSRCYFPVALWSLSFSLPPCFFYLSFYLSPTVSVSISLSISSMSVSLFVSVLYVCISISVFCVYVLMCIRTFLSLWTTGKCHNNNGDLASSAIMSSHVDGSVLSYDECLNYILIIQSFHLWWCEETACGSSKFIEQLGE